MSSVSNISAAINLTGAAHVGGLHCQLINNPAGQWLFPLSSIILIDQLMVKPIKCVKVCTYTEYLKQFVSQLAQWSERKLINICSPNVKLRLFLFFFFCFFLNFFSGILTVNWTKPDVLKVSLWTLRSCDAHFTSFSDILWTYGNNWPSGTKSSS